MVENEKYLVSGMTCAACQAHVDKAVKNLKGVKEVSVSLLTNSMLVTRDDSLSPNQISEAVKKAGYGATLASSNNSDKSNSSLKEELEDKETPKLIKILISSVIILIPLVYIAMGYMVGWPLGELAHNPFLVGLIELILASTVMLINKRFYISGIKSLIHGGGSMDTLVALGSGVAYIYSIAIMIIMAVYYPSSDHNKIMQASMNLSFETAAMVPTLITIGKTLESYSKGKTTSAIKGLLNLAPKVAHVIRDGKEIDIPADEVNTNDIFLVKPGEAFPVDGIVIEGESAVDESALTGESIPVDKVVNNKVASATINQNGLLKCKATKVGNETTLNQIVEMVKTASSTKTKISAIADKVSAIFVPTVLILSLIVFVFWMIFGNNFVSANVETTLLSYSLERAIAVIVISCPCALGLATPVAIMVGNGKAAKNGILFKTAIALEETSKINFVVLDKTGTITMGKPLVNDIIPLNNHTEKELLTLAYSLEQHSEHPLAKAINIKSEEEKIKPKDITSFKALIGHGVCGVIDSKECFALSYNSLKEKKLNNAEIDSLYSKLASEGKTPLFFLEKNEVYGVISVADMIKEDSIEAIRQFKNLGIKTIMLTGDNNLTASAIAKKIEVDEVISEVLPEDKQNIINNLKEFGKVAMIGDGINDAPALTSADIGIAIGAGSDIAIDSADIVLMKSSLLDAVAAYRLSRRTLINIKENLFWAFFYNIIMIPIAAGVFSSLGLAKLKPWMGAAAMALSSICVVTNALRLNLIDIYKSTKDKKKESKKLPMGLFRIKKEVKGDFNFDLKIEGMMCEHCVKHVKEALEKTEGISSVEVSLKDNNALIKTEKDFKDEELEKIISEAGYNLVKVERI